MSLKFVPPKAQARYAVFDYGNDENRGTFKIYNELGPAKNAAVRKIRYSNIKILENIDGEWYVLYEAAQGTSYKDLPWVKNIKRWYASYDTYRAKPMTRDEYAEWRLAVERERTGSHTTYDHGLQLRAQ